MCRSAEDTSEVQFDPEAVLSSLRAMLGVGGGEGRGGEAGESSDDTGSVDSEEEEEMVSLMEAMDSELAATAVGKSFERTKVR